MMTGASFLLFFCLCGFGLLRCGDALIDTRRFEGLTTFQVVLKVAKEHPDEVRQVAKGMVELLKDEAEKKYYMKELEAFTDPTPMPMADRGECQLCRLLMGLLRVVLLINDYPSIEPTLIEYCEFLLVAIDQTTRVKELCPGLIKLQAPYVASMVDRRGLSIPGLPNLPNYEFEIRNICEYINACIPGFNLRLPSAYRAKSTSSSRKKETKKKEENETRKKRDIPENAIKIAQLTDIHVEPNYASNSLTDCGLLVCCQDKLGAGDAHLWGNYRCNIPQRTMEHFLEKVKELNPTFVIFSGDIPPHTMWEETLESQMNCTIALTDTLKRILGDNIPAYPCVGNHEMYPTNLFSVRELVNETTVMLDQFVTHWDPLANFTDAAKATMRDTGHYTILVADKLRIVAINTLYMYAANWLNVENHRTAILFQGEANRMKTSIRNMLNQAKQNDEKVIFVGHHVPGNSDFITSESKWYEEIMSEFHDIIVLHMSGHTHTDEFRLFYDLEGSAVSMVYVSPSMDTHDYRNPSMRLFYLDPDTHEVLDYEQYYYDLKTLGATGEPTITKLYSAMDEYEMDDMSPRSWSQLLTRFEEDPALLMRHVRNSRADASASYSCDDGCLKNHVCRMERASFDDYLDCIAPVTDPTTMPISMTWPIITPPPTVVPDSPDRAGSLTQWPLFTAVFVLVSRLCTAFA